MYNTPLKADHRTSPPPPENIIMHNTKRKPLYMYTYGYSYPYAYPIISLSLSLYIYIYIYIYTMETNKNTPLKADHP